MRKSWMISRRTCLRGLGVALALPLLETMGWAENKKSGGAKLPVRLGLMYHCCGVNPEYFWPTEAKKWPTELPRTLEPLRPVIDKCLVLDRVVGASKESLKGEGDGHATELPQWFCATMPNYERRVEIDIDPSVDQIAAETLGLYTPIPSLELGTRRNERHGVSGGVNQRYWTSGSYRNRTQALPIEVDPQEIFRRLLSSRNIRPTLRGGPGLDPGQFASSQPDEEATPELSLDRSMLDLVRESASKLRKNISFDDQHQLDDYLDSVRSLEKRVVALNQQRVQDIEGGNARSNKANNNNSGGSAPLDVKIPAGSYKDLKFDEYIRVLGDLIVLAFQTDLTRVGTLVTASLQGRSYPELGFSESHHECTHHRGDKDKRDKVGKIDRYNIEQFAYIIQRMRSLKEGSGTLLDNTMFLWGSGLSNGDNHKYDRLPNIIAGGGGGSIRTGRYVENANGNQGDLLTALLARTGVPVKKPVGQGTKMMEL